MRVGSEPVNDMPRPLRSISLLVSFVYEVCEFIIPEHRKGGQSESESESESTCMLFGRSRSDQAGFVLFFCQCGVCEIVTIENIYTDEYAYRIPCPVCNLSTLR